MLVNALVCCLLLVRFVNFRECGLTCHAQCTHLVPDFCGMSMEMANNILAQISATKNKKASSSFAATNLSDRTFRPQGGPKARERSCPLLPSLPSFVDDPERREEINVHAQNLYQQQQQQQANSKFRMQIGMMHICKLNKRRDNMPLPLLILRHSSNNNNSSRFP